MKYLIFIFIVFSFISVGYAVLNKKIEIKGVSEINEASWNIHFFNIRVKEGSVSASVPATINEDMDTVNFSVSLNLPGEYYEFLIDVLNEGTIPGMIDSIIKTPELTEAQKKYLKYTVEYENGIQIEEKQLIARDFPVGVKVRVEYRTDITEDDLPTNTETLNLGVSINYVQADSTGSFVEDNGYIKTISIAKFESDFIGSEVCMDDQCFYIIGFDSEKFTLLSKYNLLVGNVNDEVNIFPIENPTGLQDPIAEGMKLSGITLSYFPHYGMVPFSNTNYWYNENDNTFKEEFPLIINEESDGISFSLATVYNSNSLLYEHVENYKNHLKKMGVNIKQARLITLEELGGLGCSFQVILSKCDNAPEWVYSTSYWVGDAPIYNFNLPALDDGSGYVVYGITNNNNLDFRAYNDATALGIRPVIEIDAIEFITRLDLDNF